MEGRFTRRLISFAAAVVRLRLSAAFSLLATAPILALTQMSFGVLFEFPGNHDDSKKSSNDDPMIIGNTRARQRAADKDKPMAAIAGGATTKGADTRGHNNTQIATVMLPSLLKTVEADKFHCALLTGVDDDNDFWMSAASRTKLEKHDGGLLPTFVHDFPNVDN